MDWVLRIGTFSIGILDIIIFIVVISSSVGCALAGISRSACKSLGWMLCYPFAFVLTSYIANFFKENTNLTYFLCVLLAFAVSAVIIYVVLNLIGSLLGNLLSSMGLGLIDGILGFFWGLFISLFICVVVLYFLKGVEIINLKSLYDNSFLYDLISPMFPSTETLIKEAFSGLR